VFNFTLGHQVLAAKTTALITCAPSFPKFSTPNADTAKPVVKTRDTRPGDSSFNLRPSCPVNPHSE
jgi:hypothetical protein